MSRSPSVTNIIDKAIVVFILIFLLSLSNSIFINQVGYYGALFLFLVRWAIVQKNPFSKSGLELPFILFIIAEIISTLLSDNQAHAFNNLLKRILLLPIVYIMIASVKDIKRGKLFFGIYIGGTIVTVLIYLYFSLHHYLDDLYGITQSGPSIFQYPITASEIISFTVIFLFAFLVNEKSGWKLKLLIGAGFLMSLISLISTYKRTGWLGAAFGIIIVLLISKKYKSLFAGFVLFAILFFVEQDISRINVYSVNDTEIKPETTINTDGKVYDVYPDENGLIISDYQNGLLFYDESGLINKIETPAPVVSFKEWTHPFYIAGLADTRFLIFKKVQDEFLRLDEFISPGYTVSVSVSNTNLFVLDSDSGLTVFRDLKNTFNYLRYPEYRKFTVLYTDSNFVCMASPDSGYRIIKHNDGILSDSVFVQSNDNISFFFYEKGSIYVSNDQNLNIFSIDSTGAELIFEFNTLGKIYKAFTSGDKTGFISAGGEITLIGNTESRHSILYQYNLGYSPNNVISFNDKLYATYIKPSRFLSIFDPYNPTNISRFALWSAGLKIWKDYPLFGVGDIDLAGYYKEYKKPYNKEIQGHMHNNFIHILVTLGAFGLFSVIFIFIKIIFIDLKIIREVREIPFVYSFAIGAFGTFCGFLFSGLTELNFWDHEITTLIWFIFGLNVALYNSVKPMNKN